MCSLLQELQVKLDDKLQLLHEQQLDSLLEDKLDSKLHGQELLNELQGLLQLLEMQLWLHLLLAEHVGLLIDVDGDEQEQLLDGELFEGEGEEQLTDGELQNELQGLLQLLEMQLWLHLLLMEQEGLPMDVDGDEQEQLLDGELFEGDGEEQLPDLELLNELQGLLHLLETQLWLHLLLEEEQIFTIDVEGDEQEQLLDRELLEREGEEQLIDFLLDELDLLLELGELQLKLILWLLSEQHGLGYEDDGELLEELLNLELFDGELEEQLLDNSLEEQLIILELSEIQLSLEQ